MTKKLFAIPALFIVLCAFQQALYHQKLGNIAAIDFPDQPTTTDTLGQHFHHYTDSSGFYLAGANDLTAKSGASFSQNDLDSLYSGYIKGILNSSGGKLINKEPYHIDELQGIEIKYITNNPNLSNLRFKRILFLNNQMLYIDFWTDKDKEAISKVSRERFFNSLKITADKASRQQGVSRTETVAYSLGYIVGQILVWATLIGIVVLIIFLIKNRKKRHSL